jgi:hypothetical protein
VRKGLRDYKKKKIYKLKDLNVWNNYCGRI